MTTAEIVLIMTTGGTVLSSLFNNFFSARRGQVSNIQTSVAQISDNTNKINEKAVEIKTQTNGNHSELMQKIDLLLTENNALREKNVTLEKSIIALAATAQPVADRKTTIRATDLAQQIVDEHTTKQ